MKRKTKVVVSNQLLDAVRFVALAQRARGDEMSTHCMIRYGTIIAQSPMLAAGARIEEDELSCFPQTSLLRAALESCSTEHQIVQREDGLFVRSGEFSAYVPVVQALNAAVPVPDAAIAPLHDAFRHSLTVTSVLAKDNARTLLQSCIQLNNGSTIATDGGVILEHWHGISMPPGLLVPKRFAEALGKVKKKLVSFGFSKTSFTVHFEDGAWLRTDLYTDKIPDMMSKLVNPSHQAEIRTGFFVNAVTVGQWSEDGSIYVYEDCIRSHHPDNVRLTAYQFPMSGLTQNVSYSLAALSVISKHAQRFDDKVAPGATMFFGDNVRGAIAHTRIVRKNICQRCGSMMRDGICQNYGCERPQSKPEDWSQYAAITDDDIPF